MVHLNPTAPSVYGGACSLARVDGATFLNCGTLARVDGAKLDRSMPSPGGSTGAVEGRYPDDLFANLYTGTFSDGYQPPRNSFLESESHWLRFNGTKWDPVGTSGARFPYIGGSSAFLVMPPASDPKDLASKPACADHACLRVVPRVIATGSVKPDFSKLKDKIAWLHAHNTQEHLPDDFAIAIDRDGPAYVVMRALDLKSNKKGYGVAKWTVADGATFTWLPAPLDAAKDAHPGEILASKGKLTFVLELPNERFVLEHDGKAWSKKPLAVGESIKGAPPEKGGKYFTTGSGVVELIGKDSRPVVGFEKGAVIAVDELGENDAWIITSDNVYRTVRPPEVLHRIESYGGLYPWPPLATKDCPHMFVVLDATAHADEYVRHTWQFDDKLPLVELKVNGLVVVGMPVATLEDGRKILERNFPNEQRLMQGSPHEVVCARPFDEKKFVSVESPSSTP